MILWYNKYIGGLKKVINFGGKFKCLMKKFLTLI